MGGRTGHLQAEEGPALAGPSGESGPGSRAEGPEVHRDALCHGKDGVPGQEAFVPVQGEPVHAGGVSGLVRFREGLGEDRGGVCFNAPGMRMHQMKFLFV